MAAVGTGEPTHLHAALAADTSESLLEMTVGQRLREQAARVPDRPAIAWLTGPGTDSLTSRTYAELLALASAAAVEIRRHTEPGDRVAVWATNTAEWVILECASALAGTVLTPCNTAWTDEEVRHALRLTTPRLLYAGPDNRGDDLVPRATGLAAEVDGCAVIGFDTVITDPSALPTEPVAVSDAPTTPSDPFLILFTSGTTGRAKGATLSQRAALNAGWTRARTFGSDDTDVWCNAIPLHHMGGSCVVLLGALSSGGCYVVQTRFDAASMLALMAATNATRTGGVPTMLYALLDLPGATEALAHIRSVGLGGTSIPPSLVERLQDEFGAAASVAYAQSECPVITTTLPTQSPVTIATTVGVPGPHTALRIVGEDGTVVARGDIGEVRVRSPFTMTGYWNMPDATAEAFDDEGYLRTGDLGSIDDDGIVRIHGRAREVIIRGGENIYPIEVEDVLLRHPGVDAVAVLAVPSDRYGEEVGAVVRSAASVPAADLEAHAAGSLAHFKVPRHWRFVDAFPLTASGKIRKVELTDLFAKDAE